MQHIVSIDNVVKSYRLEKVVVPALRGVSLAIDSGDFLAISGPSGSGKTSLLNLIGCVDTATSGRVTVAGQDTKLLSERKLTELRLNTVGFIFQSFNLIGVLSVFQNVELPLLLQGRYKAAERRQRIMTLLERVGIASHARHRPNELSGGQRQRVAIARALVARPQIVLADEPTANLDSKTGESILDLMREINRTEKTTFIFSTHDAKVLSYARTNIRLADGLIVDPSSQALPEASKVRELQK